MHVKYNTYAALLIFIITAWLMGGCERIPQVIVPEAPDEKTERIPQAVVSEASDQKIAVAVISEKDGSGLMGEAIFIETDGMVHVWIEIQNATPGLHATHLHEGTCTNVGAHWHPTEVSAGMVGVPVAEATPEIPPIGVGEIGNISVGEDGTGVLEFTTPLWSLGGEPSTDILGKLLLIHETGDTFQTHPHAGTAAHTHNMTQIQMETEMAMVETAHVCTLTALSQQIDLELDHHLPGQMLDPHSHDPLELLLSCFFATEQLLDLEFLTVIQITESPEFQALLGSRSSSLAAYHEFLLSQGAPIDPDFFTNQYRRTFETGAPEAFEMEMRMRLTHLYIASGIDFENPADIVGYNHLLTTFLDARTTAWVLGYFQGDDTAFGAWIVAVLKDVQVSAGGGARIGCGVIALMQ